MIERIAAQHQELSIAELVKTITISGDSAHARIEIYYTHDLTEPKPYFALFFQETYSDNDNTGVWQRDIQFPSCDASTSKECLKLAVETAAQDSALHRRGQGM